MRVSDIYDSYDIPPILRTHMYSVAALGSYIANSMTLPPGVIDQDLIVQTLLLHDMGNIVKFNFSEPLIGEDHNRDHWKAVQEKFIQKYGKDDHKATMSIAQEIGVSKQILRFLQLTADMETALSALKTDNNFRVMFYADFRVGPTGIVSLDERIDNLIVRYKDRNDHMWSNRAHAETMRTIIKDQEEVLQTKSSLLLNDIVQKDIGFISQSLFSYQVDLSQ